LESLELTKAPIIKKNFPPIVKKTPIFPLAQAARIPPGSTPLCMRVQQQQHLINNTNQTNSRGSTLINKNKNIQFSINK
jgi:hypothetical protein